MSIKLNKKYCYCCLNCKGAQQQQRPEFQKVVDLKDLGLTLYRYVMYPRSLRRPATVSGTKTSLDSNDIFILHNTRNNEISSADYVPALDLNQIPCLRCREMARRALRLLQFGGTIGEKSVKGICDHCLTHHTEQNFQSCFKCQEIVRKFVATLASQLAIPTPLDISIKRKRKIKTEAISPSELSPLRRDLKIDEMLFSKKDSSEKRDSHVSKVSGYETLKTKRSITDLSEASTQISDKTVTFGKIPEIIERKKLTLLETIASMDDADIGTLINDIKIALKEREDEAGIQIPYAKSLSGQIDEDLEKLVIHTLMTAKKGSDVERHVFQLIEAQDIAKSHLLEMKKRLQEQQIKVEELDMPDIIFTPEVMEPKTETTKRKFGSIEKVVHQKIIQEKAIAKKEARQIASAIRKQLNMPKWKQPKSVQPDKYPQDEQKIIKSEDETTQPAELEKYSKQQHKATKSEDAKLVSTELDKYSKQQQEKKAKPEGAKQLQGKDAILEGAKPQEKDAIPEAAKPQLAELGKYSKQPQESTKSEDDLRLAAIITKKLQKAKKDQLELKENLPPTVHSLFRQKLKPAADSEHADRTFYETELRSDEKTTEALKPIRKGVLKKTITDENKGTYRMFQPLRTRSQFNYEFFKKPVQILKPRHVSSSELIKDIREREKENRKAGLDKRSRQGQRDKTEKPEIGDHIQTEAAIKTPEEKKKETERIKKPEEEIKTFKDETIASQKETKAFKKETITSKEEMKKSERKAKEKSKRKAKESQEETQKSKEEMKKSERKAKETQEETQKSKRKAKESQEDTQKSKEEKKKFKIVMTKEQMEKLKYEIKPTKPEIKEPGDKASINVGFTKDMRSPRGTAHVLDQYQKTERKTKTQRPKVAESVEPKEMDTTKTSSNIKEMEKTGRPLSRKAKEAKIMPESIKERHITKEGPAKPEPRHKFKDKTDAEKEETKLDTKDFKELEKESKQVEKEKLEKVRKIMEDSERLKKELEIRLKAKEKEKERNLVPEKKQEEDEKATGRDVTDVLVKKLNKVLAKQDKDEKKALQMTEKLKKKELKQREMAHRKVGRRSVSELKLPDIPVETPVIPRQYSGTIIKDVTGEQYIQLPFKSIRLKGPSIDDLIIKLVKIRQSKCYKKGKEAATIRLIETIIAKKRLLRAKGTVDEGSDLDSDYLLDLESLLADKIEDDVDIIIGNKIYTPTEANTYRIKQEMEKDLRKDMKTLPDIFKKTLDFETIVAPSIPTPVLVPEAPDKKKTPSPSDSKSREEATGILRYKLSDNKFIDNGWTQLPTQKLFKKMNLYRMRPAHPEFDWFKHNKRKNYMLYDTGELLAIFDQTGHGRWYYRNGKIALEFYNAEELNAKQRTIIYSDGEPVNGRPQPITILGTFDYCGNGVVLDHKGNIRLKYNQAEGIILDKKIGPLSHWKWHDLNEPPKYEQVWSECKEKITDPVIQKLRATHEPSKPREELDIERTAIEFNNSVKEKLSAIKHKFKPFPIRMKAVKLNEYFSLRVLDQAKIYIMYRDGQTNLKLNIGMNLDPKEIVDLEFIEIEPNFKSHLEKFPALSESINDMQNKIAEVRGQEYQYRRRENWLRRKLPISSTDNLVAALSRPLRSPPRHFSPVTDLSPPFDFPIGTLPYITPQPCNSPLPQISPLPYFSAVSKCDCN